MKKFLSLAIALLCIVISLSIVSCGNPISNETTVETTAGNNPTETTVDGTSAESSPEPLPDKTAAELYAMAQSYVENLGNRNINATIKLVTDGKSHMSEEEGTMISLINDKVLVKGIGTDSFALVLEETMTRSMVTVSGETGERSVYEKAVVVDGIAYVLYQDGEEVEKSKLTVSEEDALDEANLYHSELLSFDFSTFLNASVNKGEDSYTLTITGFTTEGFYEYVLGVGEDRDDIERFEFDNAKDFTMTVVIGRNGNVISIEAFLKYVDNCEKINGSPINYSYTQEMKVEFSEEIPEITAPADADEYKSSDLGPSGPEENDKPNHEETFPGVTDQPDIPAEISAEELYLIIEKYFDPYSNPAYVRMLEEKCTVNGVTTSDGYANTIVFQNYGTPNAALYNKMEDEEFVGICICIDGYAYIEQTNGEEEYKIKTKMSVEELLGSTSVGEGSYGLPFTFEELGDVTITCVDDRFILKVNGVSEEAYVREILGLDFNENEDGKEQALNMAREHYTYKPEEYTATYIVSSDGTVEYFESSVSYTLKGSEEIGMEEGVLYEYDRYETINQVTDVKISAPKDADKYSELNMGQ